MVSVNLYGKSECGLCDEAEALLSEVLRVSSLDERYTIRKIDIETDDTLMAQYGMSIPVVRREDSGEALYWPFPASRLRDFLLA